MQGQKSERRCGLKEASCTRLRLKEEQRKGMKCKMLYLSEVSSVASSSYIQVFFCQSYLNK